MAVSFSVWQLHVIQSNKIDHDWIHPKAKFHFFVDDRSLCGKYVQDTKYFETDISSSEILRRPEIACKKCYNLWAKNQLV